MDADRDEDDGDDYDAPHDLRAVRDPDGYWRRRFFILGGGIAVVGACVWLFPGAHHPAARTASTAGASMAALDKRGELPASAYGSTWAGQAERQKTRAKPTANARAEATSTATATAAAANHRKAGTAYHPAVSPSPTPSASGKGPRCAPSDIVLSLFTLQPSYGEGALPKFDVYAVSTSSSACTLSYGPGSVQVVVTRRGRVVWDSAACKLSASAPTRFTLGVPQVLTITWNRRAAGPSGCAGSLPAGTQGTFDAVALTDGQSSPVRSFKLTG